jgi:DNA polymerase elongation subunit (family B)
MIKDEFYTSVNRHRNLIRYRGYTGEGKRIQSYHDFKPTFFLPVKELTAIKTLKGENLKKYNPGTMRECDQFVRKYKDFSNAMIYGNERYENQFISDYFPNANQVWQRDLINVTTIDIEVQSDHGFPDPKFASYPITAITIKSNKDEAYYVWALGPWDDYKSEVKMGPNEHVHYVRCFSEKDLLDKFIDHWQVNYPDVVTGWNSTLFDWNYLINRFINVFNDGIPKKFWNGKKRQYEDYQISKRALKLSPWKEISKAVKDFGGETHPWYDTQGIELIDYLPVFKKYAYTYGTQESYKLDNIANVVLGERKLDYSEYGSLNVLYKENHQKFVDYNIRDVQVVQRIEEKLGLLTLCFEVAYKGLTNYRDSFGSVVVWDSIIYNDLRSKKIACPPRKKSTKERQIEGAHVKDPIIGMHEWVMSFDLNSLYPHIIMQYNMSPETIIPTKIEDVSVKDLIEDKDYKMPNDTCMAATGQCFSITKPGIIPRLIAELYADRSSIKKKMLKLKREKANDKEIAKLDTKQLALKILMNTLYGALSNEYFRYFDPRIAEGITITGQYTIRSAEKAVNDWMNKRLQTSKVDYVIAIDTDSLYVNFGPMVKKFMSDKSKQQILNVLDKDVAPRMEKLFEDTYKKLQAKMNCKTQMMQMKREVIADKGIWTGKKHYMLSVLDSEGVRYDEPDIKMMGIEAVRSSTPNIFRKLIKKTIQTIMTKDEQAVQDLIREERDKILDLQYAPEDVAFPRGVSNMDKYKDRSSIYRKATPIHVRGALLYNYFLTQHNLDKKYEKIFSGDKIKFLYLKLPNRVKENVIAFNGTLPEEFRVKEHIDYDLQFDKGYLEPIKSILETIGWDTEKRATLEDFF